MIEIFILCRNRPILAKKCIESVQLQVKKNYKIVISDNSTDNRVQDLCEKYFTSLEYRKRDNIPMMHHFEICIKEAKENYYCLFHDDDLMLPFFTYFIDIAISKFPESIAFGVNSYVLNRDNTLNHKFFFDYKKYTNISDPDELSFRYFSKHSNGFAAFPGYVYCRARTEIISFPTINGINADFIWLAKLIKEGPILLINKSLMIYRYHESNVSNIEVFKDRMSLLAYIKNNLSEKSIFMYRFFIVRTLASFRLRNAYVKKYKLKYIELRLILFLKYVVIRIHQKFN